MKNIYIKYNKIILSGFVLVFSILIFSFSICNAFTVGVPANFLSLNSGLVGYWTFDGKDVVNGVVRDKSGNGNHGNPLNIATSTFYAPGKIGQGFKFDGSNDYINVPSSSSLNFGANQDFSISIWYYAIKTGSGGLISKRAGSGAGFVISYNTLTSNANVVFSNSSNTTYGFSATDVGLVANSWNLITVTVSRSGNMVLYKNGVLFNQISVSAGAADDLGNSTALQIGEWTAAGRPFGGTLDDVRIYNRVLSAQEVRQIYNMGAATKAAVSATASSSPLTNGLVGYWTFDGKDVVNGVVRDKSGNGNNGNPINIATSTFYTSGKIGQGFNFDGVNDYVDTAVTPYNFEKTDPFSTSLWFMTPVANTGTNPTYISNYTSRGWFVGNGVASVCSSGITAKIGLLLFNGTQLYACVSANPTYNKWHHLVTTYDGSVTVGGIKIYIDGVLQSIGQSANTLTGTIVSAAKLRIGDDTTSDYTKGVLDDVRIYNRVLSVQEVQQLYNMGAATKAAVSATASSSPLTNGLVGYWTFDGKDVVNGVVRDKSGNGNNGNPLNIATSTFYAPGKIGQGLRFDGVNDILDCGTNSSVLPDVFTFSAWVKNNNLSATGALMGLGNNATPLFQLSNNANRPLGQLANNNYRYWSATSPTNIINNNWHHYVWVVTGNTINDINNSVLYIDGKVQDVFSTVTSEAPASKSRCKLGGQHTAGTINPFNGTLDEVRIYNRALSAQEALELYNMGK